MGELNRTIKLVRDLVIGMVAGAFVIFIMGVLSLGVYKALAALI